jgi:hypothetical protein
MRGATSCVFINLRESAKSADNVLLGSWTSTAPHDAIAAEIGSLQHRFPGCRGLCRIAEQVIQRLQYHGLDHEYAPDREYSKNSANQNRAGARQSRQPGKVVARATHDGKISANTSSRRDMRNQSQVEGADKNAGATKPATRRETGGTRPMCTPAPRHDAKDGSPLDKSWRTR